MRDALPSPLAQLLPAEEAGGRPSRPVAVRLAEVEEGVAEDRFETSGEVVAAEAVALAAEVSARVAEVFAEDGARLEAGDPILRFDDASQRGALEAARAAAAEAEAELARQRELQNRGVVAEARVETARAAAESARAEVSAAERRLEDRTVRAPFGGVVGFVDVSPGAVLAPGDPIARLRTENDLRVRAALPQALAERAGEAGEARLRPEGASEDCGRAEVRFVSPLADAASRTRTLEARLPEGCDLAPGAFVAVSVLLERRDGALFVPQSAVLREGFAAWAWRAEEDEGGLVARRASLELGSLTGDRFEVPDGLAAGDRVVVSGVQKVSDGTRLVSEGGGEDAASEGGGSEADASEDGASEAGGAEAAEAPE